MIDRLKRSELFRAEYGRPFSLGHKDDCPCGYCLTKPVALPLMAKPQPDTAERTRLAVQSIPFALPEKRNG